MAKTMAYIEDHQVTNLIWCDDSALESDVLRETGLLPVAIGDYFDGTYFYRLGCRVLTEADELRRQMQEMQQIQEQLDEAVVALEYENTMLLLGLDEGGEWDAV